MIRLVKYFYFLMLLGGFLSCQDVKPKETNNVFELIPTQTSYIFKVNNDSVLAKRQVLTLNRFVSKKEQEYLQSLAFSTPFIINVLQNNTKIKGFVAVGKTAKTDSIFNGTVTNYEGYSIYDELIGKRHYFATQIDGQTLVSNQKLFIENCIRQKEALHAPAQNKIFQLGINTLDANADVNMIVNLSKLDNDPFYKTSLQVPVSTWADYEFYDLIDQSKQVYTGMSLVKDSISKFLSSFSVLQASPSTTRAFVPYAASEIITFSFDDYALFYEKYRSFFKTANPAIDHRLLDLTGISFFRENHNKALVLSMSNTGDFVGDHPLKVLSLDDINIYKCRDSLLVSKYFDQLIPTFTSSYYTVLDKHVILAETKSYLQKVINDYQNHSTLTDAKFYKDLAAEMPDNFIIEMVQSRMSIDGQKYIAARSYNSEDENIFVNFVMKPIQKNSRNALVEQMLSYELKDQPAIAPQLVFNHKTKQYNIIYQNEQNQIVLLNLQGKILWKTKVKGAVTGQIKQVDLLRNHKLQYTFVTTHHWYVIDRLGRIVENFPEHFTQKITQGISVFDYDHNRKYRFGITQGKKFRLYDNKAQKVKGFKVKTDNLIIKPPKHFRISNKDFIVMQDDDEKLYLLNRRGETRIKMDKTFHTRRNDWGVYKQKFVNIDDDNNLISINLNGKVKTAHMNLGDHILSQIKHQTLTAISGNKLLINQQINTLDLGNYARPLILKQANQIFVFVSDIDNHKIYGFDQSGKSLSKFPIIGQELLDVKAYRSAKYILAYDSQHNLIVYKF